VHHQYQRHRLQILPPVSLVLLILVANFLLVSTKPVTRRQIATGINDTAGKFVTGVVDSGGKKWEQLSEC
jgi:hypothetical protein